MRRARGQTLAIFALTLLLGVLMVLFTLSIGSRVREHIEAQTAADTAAYSQAVAAARTFNHVALLNRALIAALSAHTALQSLVSWSGHHVGNLEGTIAALQGARGRYDDCVHAGRCTWGGQTATRACAAAERASLDAAIGLLAAERARILADWNTYDDAAGFRAQEQYRWFSTITGMNLRMYAGVTDKHRWILGEPNSLQVQVAGQTLTRSLIKATDPELAARPQADRKSWEEIDLRSGLGAGTWPGGSGDAQRAAVMGSRGHAFSTARADGARIMRERLEHFVQQVNPAATVAPVDSGGSGFGADREASTTFAGLGNRASWTHDHGGTLTVTWPTAGRCPEVPASDLQAVVPDSWAMMADRTIDSEHVWAGSDSRPPTDRHGWEACDNGCPNMWPAFVDYNLALVGDARNDFGMPKLYSIVERDYAARSWRDPWDLFLTLDIARRGPRTLDTRPGHRGGNLQVAVGAGIAYYHRPGAWQEPPNFFNPFWRATLVHPDADLSARLSAAGYDQQAATLDALGVRGFEGLR